MAETFTANLNLDQPALGEYVNSWNVPINGNFGIIDDAIAGVTVINLTNADVVLTNVQSAFRIIAFTGTLTANVTVTLTSVTGQWIFSNQTTGAFTVTIKGSSVDTGIVIRQGANIDLACGTGNVMSFTGVVSVASRQGDVTLAVADVSGAAPLASPSLTGTPTAPTQATGDNTTAIATDAFVNASIAAQVARVPQVTVLTSGSGTYTTPAGATYLEVTDMCGGGSGGGGSGSGGGTGAGGGATLFGTSLLTANGGPATPANTSTTYPVAATATGGDLNITGGLGGGPNVMNGGAPGNGLVSFGASSSYGGGGGPGTLNAASGSIAAGNANGFGSGGGAGGYGANVSVNSGWGGNAAASLKKIITSPASSYTYSIGDGGTGGAQGTSGQAGGNGSGGFIRVVAHFQ